MKRQSKNLSSALEKRLNLYALAASAAGVGVLALAQPAEAKIIYTPAHVRIGVAGVSFYDLDLNHDGITDFRILAFTGTTLAPRDSTHWIRLLSAYPATKGFSNDVECVISLESASALHQGRIVGPLEPFDIWGKMVEIGYYNNRRTNLSGRWVNVKDRYLGLRFVIKGHLHYGWARLSVRVLPISIANTGIAATLTGYAYETVPNKPIIAGKTMGPDVITLEPASLGHLAAAVSAVPAWRVKRQQ